MRQLGAGPYARVALLVLLLALPGCDKPTTPTRPADDAQAAVAEPELAAAESPAAGEAGSGIPFAAAQLFFELNATDNDMGVQLFLDSDGSKRVRVLDPGRREILLVEAEGRLAKLGITELRFESAEPSPEEVLALFPPGQYRFRGRSVEGETLASDVTLSHDFPPTPTFSPSGGEVVARGTTVVEWNAPGAERVEIILENDELGHVFDVTLSGTSRRLKVPPQFLTPGAEYKIEILSIAESGNRTIVGSTFRVAP